MLPAGTLPAYATPRRPPPPLPSRRYVASLGAYRALYIVNWVYRFFTEPHYRSWIAWIAGVIQTAFYADFFYYFAISKAGGANGLQSGVLLPS